jgi:nitroreductase
MHIDIPNAAETGHQMHSDAQVVDSVIRSRKAVRVFRSDAVSQKDIIDILDVARTAPSNSNMQPWRVHVLRGRSKESLSEALVRAHVADLHPPLQHVPDPMPEAYRPMQEEFGARYYGALGIDKADVAGRARATGRNFGFFGAPVGLIFTIDARLKKHSWLDYGLFLQTVMIAARARGLDTCPQVSFARYQTIIAEHLLLEPGFDVVCGMSLGYADHDSVVNRLAIPRETVERFTTFVGFDEKA